MSETSILYLIRYASVILNVGVHLLTRMYMPTSEHCWKKNSGAQWARSNQQSQDYSPNAFPTELHREICRGGFKFLLLIHILYNIIMHE